MQVRNIFSRFFFELTIKNCFGIVKTVQNFKFQKYLILFKKFDDFRIKYSLTWIFNRLNHLEEIKSVHITQHHEIQPVKVFLQAKETANIFYGAFGLKI